MRNNVWEARCHLIRWYCFRRFFLNVVRAWAMVFSTIVAWTSTRPDFNIGRPVNVNLSPPVSNTLCNRIWSPMVGAQYPSITTRSPAVTLNCLPHRCTTANKRPSDCSLTKLFTLLITFSHTFGWTFGFCRNSILAVSSKNDFFGTNDAPEIKWGYVREPLFIIT